VGRNLWQADSGFLFGEKRMTEELLKQEAAAHFLGLRPTTLELWRSRGDGPRFVRLSRRAVRYRLSELIKFAVSREITPVKKTPRFVAPNRGVKAFPARGRAKDGGA
jgi:predicted DNA-binding transcriptional regulator AlpA